MGELCVLFCYFHTWFGLPSTSISKAIGVPLGTIWSQRPFLKDGKLIFSALVWTTTVLDDSTETVSVERTTRYEPESVSSLRSISSLYSSSETFSILVVLLDESCSVPLYHLTVFGFPSTSTDSRILVPTSTVKSFNPLFRRSLSSPVTVSCACDEVVPAGFFASTRYVPWCSAFALSMINF